MQCGKASPQPVTVDTPVHTRRQNAVSSVRITYLGAYLSARKYVVGHQVLENRLAQPLLGILRTQETVAEHQVFVDGNGVRLNHLEIPGREDAYLGGEC